MKGKKRKTKRVKKGFTLVELIMAIFVFSLLMTAVTGIFVKLYWSYRNAKAIQRDAENAQFALNMMAKTLRTSRIIIPATNSSAAADITVYDYSRPSFKCIRYRFNAGSLQTGSFDAADEASCSVSDQNLAPMTTGIVTGQFNIIQNSVSAVGKVTISMEVCPPGGCSGGDISDRVRIQSAVSLRNYTEAAP